MRFTRTKAVLAGLALAATAACGDAGSDDEGGADVDVEKDAASSFEDGTKMKELADAGKITVGVKFDQPGLGFKGAADKPVGLRRRDGQDPRRRARHRRRERHHLEGDDLRQPRAVPAGRRGRPGARVVLHHRRAPQDRRPGRPLPTTGQQLLVKKDSDDQERRRPQGQGGLLGDRARPRWRTSRPRARSRVGFDTYSECVDAGARRHRRGDDHRRHDPARATPRRTRASSRSSATPFSEERYGVGYSKDNPEMCEWINDTLRSRSTTAPGRRRSRPRSASRAPRHPSRRRWTPARPDRSPRRGRPPRSRHAPHRHADRAREEATRGRRPGQPRPGAARPSG